MTNALSDKLVDNNTKAYNWSCFLHNVIKAGWWITPTYICIALQRPISDTLSYLMFMSPNWIGQMNNAPSNRHFKDIQRADIWYGLLCDVIESIWRRINEKASLTNMFTTVWRLFIEPVSCIMLLNSWGSLKNITPHTHKHIYRALQRSIKDCLMPCVHEP